MKRPLMMAVAAVALAAAPGCRRAELSGPPELRIGRDECAACGMLVMEDRSSCAILVEENGHRLHRVFDDPGCMLDFIADHRPPALIGTFVHDYSNGAWVDGDGASYVVGSPDAIRTPMGSGIAAFATPGAAGTLRDASGGEIARFDGVARARRAWQEGRRAGGAASP